MLKLGIDQDGPRRFVIFSLISLKYDVTDAILQGNRKMKVQHLRSLSFDLFEILQAVKRLAKEFHLISNFVALATKIRMLLYH